MKNIGRKLSSLYARLFALSVFPVVMTLLIIGGFAIKSIVSTYHLELKLHLNNVSAIIAYIADEVSDEEMSQKLETVKKDTDLNFVIKTNQGILTTFKDDDEKKLSNLIDKIGQEKGGELGLFDKTLNGVPYYCVYKDGSNRKILALFSKKKTRENLYGIINELIRFAVVLMTIVVLENVFVSKKIVRVILQNVSGIKKIASGNLAFQIDRKVTKRKDELGDIGNEMNSLIASLTAIVNSIKENSVALKHASNELKDTSLQSSKISDEFSVVVEEIAEATTSQAVETQSVYHNMQEIEHAIEQIVTSIQELSKNSDDINTADQSATSLLLDLCKFNEETLDSIHKIAAQINMTNDSAEKIKEASTIIADIAEETSLLALNASIEAARAGEAGRGFSIVAGEIQKLSEETSQSANEINQIIAALVENSSEMVNMMTEVNNTVNNQSQKLERTQEEFEDVSVNIQKSVSRVNDIKMAVAELDKQKDSTMKNIKELETLSQNNAASTQEATASCEEMNAGVNNIAQASIELNQISDTLMEKIKFFELAE